MTNILTEAVGCLTAAYLIKAIKSAGYISFACDTNPNNAGRYLTDHFIQVPPCSSPVYLEKMYQVLKTYQIDVFIPSLDETLYAWSCCKKACSKKNCLILLSDPESIKICQDKWLTYNFFVGHGIPTPETSLEQKFRLIKPRLGRGGEGVFLSGDGEYVDMKDKISQEVLYGQEVTIDIFCEKSGCPVYIVPRRRIMVVKGKSVVSVTFESSEITKWVKKICSCAHFIGPINVQCFIDPKRGIIFTEINPRFASGMALSFAATHDNWVELIEKHFLKGKTIHPKPIDYNLQMFRYYDEIFVSQN